MLILTARNATFEPLFLAERLQQAPKKGLGYILNSTISFFINEFDPVPIPRVPLKLLRNQEKTDISMNMAAYGLQIPNSSGILILWDPGVQIHFYFISISSKTISTDPI